MAQSHGFFHANTRPIGHLRPTLQTLWQPSETFVGDPRREDLLNSPLLS